MTKPTFNIKSSIMLLLVLFFGIAFFFTDVLTLDNIKNNEIQIRHFINNHYVIAVSLFFASCVIFINSPVPLAAVLKLLGGFFFGFYLGALYNITATILACLVGFGISRYSFRELFEKRYYEKLKAVENEIEKNGFYYFLSLRLVIVVPYFLINILAGLSRISFRKYAFSTVIGVMPASLIYANGGGKLEQIDSLHELFRADTVFSLLLVALISLLPAIKRSLNDN